MLQMSHMKWCQKIWAHMRAVTSGVSTGGTVALVLKLLNWADKQPLAVPPVFEPLPWQLDGPSFVLGVAVGLTAYVVVEFFLTVKWAFIAWVSCQRGEAPPAPPRPLYKIL